MTGSIAQGGPAGATDLGRRSGRRGLGTSRPSRTERGAVTVELAVGLIGIVLVLALVLLLTAAATTQLRCTEAARSGARAAALGQEDSAVVEVAGRAAGGGAHVEVVRADGWVTVTVDRPVVGVGVVGPLDARASSSTPVEP